MQTQEMSDQLGATEEAKVEQIGQESADSVHVPRREPLGTHVHHRGGQRSLNGNHGTSASQVWCSCRTYR